MSDAYYDIVVVGTELTGLITAANLAKKGYRVLVLGHGNRRNMFLHEGFPFIRRPWLFSGFETSTPIKKVLNDLSLSLEMHNRPKPFDPFYQVVMPGRRIDVAAKEGLFQRELEREFPGEVAGIQQFYRLVREQNEVLSNILDTAGILPPETFREKRAWRKLVAADPEQAIDPLSTFPKGHPFRPFVLAPLMFTSGCYIPPYSAFQLIRSVTHLGRGLYRIEGGIDALKDIFIEKVKSNCGDYREKVQVDRFVMRRGKAREIVIRDRREVIGCDVVVCNTDVKRFFNLIPEEAQKQRFHLKILELQPTHLLYTVNFALRAEAIPAGMGRHVFMLQDPSKPPEGHNLLLLSVDPAGSPEADGVRVLSATIRLPTRAIRPTMESLHHHDERIMANIRGLIHFFDEHLLARASAWVGYEKRTRQPFVDTTQQQPVFGSPLEGTLHMSAIACRTAYKNILITGDHLHSGLGFEGAFLGSLHAVQLTQELVSRRTLLS